MTSSRPRASAADPHVHSGWRKWKSGARVADLGCGSGVFTDLLHQQGFDAVGLDLSPKLIALGQAKYPDVDFFEGDVEHLPFADASLDGVLLSGLCTTCPIPRAARPRCSGC